MKILKNYQQKPEGKIGYDQENAFLSKELAIIDCHVPLSVSLKDVHLGETDLYNNDELYALLEELEFRTLMNRLIKKRWSVSVIQESGSADAEASKLSSNDNQELLSSEMENGHAYLEVKCSLIKTGEELRSILSELSNKNRIALAMDVKGEHQLDFWLKGLAICGDGEKAFYIDLDHAEIEKERNYWAT